MKNDRDEHDTGKLRRGKRPSNIVTASELDGLRRELNVLRRRNEALAEEVAALNDTAGHAQRRIVEMEAIVAGFEASTSWRATRPLRSVRAFAARLRPRRPTVKAILRRPFLWVMRKGLAHPRGRHWARRVLSRIPRLEARLHRIGENAGLLGPPQANETTSQLSARAARVYRQIVAAAERTGS